MLIVCLCRYREQWKAVKREIMRPRWLKHHCKLVILSRLGFQGGLVQELPLPTTIRQYLVADVC